MRAGGGALPLGFLRKLGHLIVRPPTLLRMWNWQSAAPRNSESPTPVLKYLASVQSPKLLRPRHHSGSTITTYTVVGVSTKSGQPAETEGPSFETAALITCPP